MFCKFKNGEVKIADTEMNYVSFGSGSKVLVILPGLSDGITTVKGKALVLAKPYAHLFKDYTVYMFSRRNTLPEGHSIKDMADDQAYALKELGIDKANFMGVSQGGMIVQCIGIYHPELVEKLVIAVSAPYANDTIKSCVNNWINLARQKQIKDFVTDMNGKAYTPQYLKKYERFYPIIVAALKRISYDRFYVNANAILDFDVRDKLSSIKCPTLILGGKEDQIVTAEASIELHNFIENSEIYLYDGLGHAAFEETPDFNDRVYKFLEQKD